MSSHSRCSYDPNCKDSCGVSPLMDASRGDNVLATIILMKEFGSQLDIEDTLGRQAIHHAAQAGAVGVLRCLVEHGADVNKKASVNHITPLHYAAKVSIRSRLFCICFCIEHSFLLLCVFDIHCLNSY